MPKLWPAWNRLSLLRAIKPSGKSALEVIARAPDRRNSDHDDLEEILVGGIDCQRLPPVVWFGPRTCLRELGRTSLAQIRIKPSRLQ